MTRYFSLVLTIICLFSCKEKKSDNNKVFDKTMDQLTIDTPDYAAEFAKDTSRSKFQPGSSAGTGRSNPSYRYAAKDLEERSLKEFLISL